MRSSPLKTSATCRAIRKGGDSSARRGALLRGAGLELLLVEGNHDDAEALARADARTLAPGPVRLGFRLHHLPAGTRFRLGRLRCLAYGGSPTTHAGRGWYRAAALERAAFDRLAGGGKIDLLFCHDPRTLEEGAKARGPDAALAAKLRPALVIYAGQHRPYVSAAGRPALVGLGSFRDGQSSESCSTATRHAGSTARSAGGSPRSRKPPDRTRHGA